MTQKKKEDRGPDALRIVSDFVHLGDHGDARTLPVTESFWPDLVAGRLGVEGGRLVSAHEFREDWNAWERHPGGDELVVLVSGAMTFLLDPLEQPDATEGLQSIRLDAPGAFLVVPRGAWHTAHVHAPSLALFVTAGEGTEHRPA